MKKIYSAITFPGLLSAFSFVIILLILTIYFIGNISNIDTFKSLFNNAWDRGFIWFTIIFVLLCNFDHLREIMKSAVREKMDSLVISDIREEIIYKIENDPDMLKKLKNAEIKKQNQEFINKSIN